MTSCIIYITGISIDTGIIVSVPGIIGISMQFCTLHFATSVDRNFLTNNRRVITYIKILNWIMVILLLIDI